MALISFNETIIRLCFYIDQLSWFCWCPWSVINNPSPFDVRSYTASRWIFIYTWPFFNLGPFVFWFSLGDPSSDFDASRNVEKCRVLPILSKSLLGGTFPWGPHIFTGRLNDAGIIVPPPQVKGPVKMKYLVVLVLFVQESGWTIGNYIYSSPFFSWW